MDRWAFWGRGCLLALLLCSCGVPRAPRSVSSPAYPAADRSAVLHLLNRAAFGPRSGEVERVVETGIGAWIEDQLSADGTMDSSTAEAMVPYRDALRSQEELWELFNESEGTGDNAGMSTLPPSAELALRPQNPSGDASCRTREDGLPMSPFEQRRCQRQRMRMELRELEGIAAMATLVRHLHSSAQLREVLTDFWTNHFNVFARKGPVRYLATDFVETAIRPHVFDRFETMLRATARHPAMLVYLDNWRSTAQRGAGRGINENYARELLELHTLGVHGGYNQHDVIDVARVLTGWSASSPAEGPMLFEFRAGWHDRGEKVILGERYPAGGGEDEGNRLLHQLAEHPSTARHLATQLVQRFVADHPPEAIVTSVAQTWRETHGDQRAVLRTLLRHPDFWAPQHRGNKLKTPLEFLVSTLRILGARVDGTDRLGRLLARMGQGYLLNPVPTGYSDVSSEWAHSAGALDRINVSLQLARASLPGVSFDLDTVIPLESTPEAQAQRVVRIVLSGAASERTNTVLRSASMGLAPRQVRALQVSLALGSPEFQQQ